MTFLSSLWALKNSRNLSCGNKIILRNCSAFKCSKSLTWSLTTVALSPSAAIGVARTSSTSIKETVALCSVKSKSDFAPRFFFNDCVGVRLIS